ncbi:MAG TPA: hypothetical protein VFX97_11925 [Pyrinomonadaceae bacterium]|nr:hypothetical protein [Pyrinomonadaceae bacterium]
MSRDEWQKAFKEVLRSLRGKRRPSLGRRLIGILRTTALALALTIAYPFLGVMPIPNVVVAIVLLVVVLYVLPFAVLYNIFRSVVLPFERRIAWQKRVYLVLVGYLAMILTYGGVYFAIAGSGDYSQAVHTNVEFEYLLARDSSSVWERKSRQELIDSLPNQRPFLGINYPLYLAIHQDRVGDLDRKYLTAVEILHRSRDEVEAKPRLDSGAFWNLLGECLHYSISRAAGGGSGDIVPTTVMAKLIADSEVLISWGILGFGLGLVMGDRPKVEARDRKQ